MITQLRDDPLPGFVKPVTIIRSASGSIRPPAMVRVSECAEKHVRLNNPGAYVGPYKNSMAPYLVEPMDRSVIRAVDELHFVAPSQSGKSQLFLNIIAHGIKYKPGDILLVQPNKDMAEDFAERRIEKKMLEISPDLADELGPDRSDKKLLSKNFNNGLMLTVVWPVPAQLASRAVPVVIFDERDRMPDDIGKEGDPIELGRNRKRTYKRNGSLINVSSPSRDYSSGVVGHFYEGDQRLWFWPCLQCGEYWSPGFGFDRKPTFKHLALSEECEIDEVHEKTVMCCPHCGGFAEERDKRLMNTRGVWLADGQTIDAEGKISGLPPDTRIASYWLSGIASPFIEIGELHEKYLRALTKLEREQDDKELKAVVNTGFGFPYIPRHAGAAPIDVEELKDRKENFDLKSVPEGVRFLVGSVDVGAHKFDIQVTGYNEDGESWLIDRYTLKQKPDGRPLDPPNILSDWDVIKPLINARYPLATDNSKHLPVGAVAIDNGGASGEDLDGNTTSGVSVMSKNFVRALYSNSVPMWQVVLIKGASNQAAPILPQRPTWERDDNGDKVENSVPLHVIGVHSLKNIVDNRVRLSKAQPGFMHFPKDTPDNVFDELAGERKIKGKWVRKGPNESFDLYAYSEALRQKLRPDRVDWSSPPIWAMIIEDNDPSISEPATVKKSGRRTRSRGI